VPLARALVWPSRSDTVRPEPQRIFGNELLKALAQEAAATLLAGPSPTDGHDDVL